MRKTKVAGAGEAAISGTGESWRTDRKEMWARAMILIHRVIHRVAQDETMGG